MIEAAATRNPKTVQLPIEYMGDVLEGNRKGAVMPPVLEMAIIPPVARAVAVEPRTVAVRCYDLSVLDQEEGKDELTATKGRTAAFVQAIRQTAKYLTPQCLTSARSKYPIPTKVKPPRTCFERSLVLSLCKQLPTMINTAKTLGGTVIN